jgi:hypothetical protein
MIPLITSIPLPSDPQPVFDTKVPLCLESWNQSVTAANADLQTIGLAHTSTSDTSTSISLGVKSFTVQTGLGYVVGMTLKIASAASPNNSMIGYVNSYNPSTGVLSVTVTKKTGAGTYADWSISVGVDSKVHETLPYAVTTGSGAAYLASFDPVIDVDDTATVKIKFHANCVPNATIQFNGQFPVKDIKIKRTDGVYAPVSAGDIKAGDTLIAMGVESGTSILLEPSVLRSNITYLTAPATLTLETSLDVTFVINTPLTVDLPFVSTYQEGFGFSVIANANSTFNRQGTDSIVYFGDVVSAVGTLKGDLLTFTKSGGNWLCTATNLTRNPFTNLAPINTTSGTNLTLANNIANTVKRITLQFAGLSTSGTSIPIIRLGVGGVAETTNYLGGASTGTTGGGGSVGISLSSSNAASHVRHGSITLTRMGETNTWVASGILNHSDSSLYGTVAYSKSLAGALNSIFLTTTNGTDTFDAGSVSVTLEV